jgi:hypothetical protein
VVTRHIVITYGLFVIRGPSLTRAHEKDTCAAGLFLRREEEARATVWSVRPAPGFMRRGHPRPSPPKAESTMRQEVSREAESALLLNAT